MLYVDGKEVRGPIAWNGQPAHARVENLAKWTQVWKRGILKTTEFTEHGKTFQSPFGIHVLVLRKQTNHIVIVTRDAETDEEKAIHPRFPLLGKPEDIPT